MVLVQSAPGPSASRGFMSRIHPSPTRIAGAAGAILLNTVLFMLLMAPMGVDLPLPVPEDDLIVVPISDPIEQPPKPPPVDEEPETQPRPTPPVISETTPEPTETPPVLIEQGSVIDQPVVDPAPPATSTVPANPAPVAGVRLQYASATPPPYPRRELADRIEGQVLLRVLVDVDGKPLEVSIERSSGNRELDRAAQQHILRHWTFHPAMKDGRAVQTIGLVPIDFKLQ